jgi:hypothetical protein
MLINTSIDVSLEAIVETLGAEIKKRAADSRGAVTSIVRLEALADQLDDLVAGVEAHMELHMAGISAPALTDIVPPWAASQLAMISPELAPVKYQASCVLQVVERLSGSTLRGHIVEGLRGSVEITWTAPKFIRWLVQQPSNKWPGVLVRVFYVGSNGKMKTRMFRWVESLTEHLVWYLTPEGRKED